MKITRRQLRKLIAEAVSMIKEAKEVVESPDRSYSMTYKNSPMPMQSRVDPEFAKLIKGELNRINENSDDFQDSADENLKNEITRHPLADGKDSDKLIISEGVMVSLLPITNMNRQAESDESRWMRIAGISEDFIGESIDKEWNQEVQDKYSDDPAFLAYLTDEDYEEDDELTQNLPDGDYDGIADFADTDRDDDGKVDGSVTDVSMREGTPVNQMPAAWQQVLRNVI